jgi:ribosomal protein S3
MIHSGQPARDFIDYADRHVLLLQGVLGIKVKPVDVTHSHNVHLGLVIWVQMFRGVWYEIL